MPYQNIEERVDRLEDLLTTFASELRQDIAEMRQWRLQAQKQWGEIAQKMGTFVEDIVAPNIPRLGREVFAMDGGEGEVFSGPRVRVRHPHDPSKLREFDYVYATRNGWIVVASRSSPKLNDVDEFRSVLAEAGECFPQFAGLPLRPIFASLYLPEHVVKYCTRHRIHALGMGLETMQLLNLSELPLTPPASQP